MIRNILVNSKVANFSPMGYVTAANVEQFQNKLQVEITKQNFNVFLVDLSEVVFIDSAGLMSLIKAFRSVQEMGKRFVICGITAPVRIVFELARVDEVIEIYQEYTDFEATILAAA